MVNKTKKLLLVLASTVAISGFTADVALNSNPTTVSAAKHSKKKSGLTPRSKYSSSGEWYLHNAKYLYEKYNGKGLFAKGYDDSCWSSGFGVNFATANYKNKYYKYGWIIGLTASDHSGHQNRPSTSSLYGFTTDNYNKSIKRYKEAVQYIETRKPTTGYIELTDTNPPHWQDN